MLLRRVGGMRMRCGLRSLSSVSVAGGSGAEGVRDRRPRRQWTDKHAREVLLEALALHAATSDATGGVDATGSHAGDGNDVDWTHLRAKDVVAVGGGGLLNISGSLDAAIRLAYPETEWGAGGPRGEARRRRRKVEEEESARARRHEEERRRAYIAARVGRELGIREWDDWRRVTPTMVRNAGGGSLLFAWEREGGGLGCHVGVFGVVHALGAPIAGLPLVRPQVPSWFWRGEEEGGGGEGVGGRREMRIAACVRMLAKEVGVGPGISISPAYRIVSEAARQGKWEGEEWGREEGNAEGLLRAEGTNLQREDESNVGECEEKGEAEGGMGGERREGRAARKPCKLVISGSDVTLDEIINVNSDPEKIREKEREEVEEWHRVGDRRVRQARLGRSLLAAVPLHEALPMAYPHGKWRVEALIMPARRSSQHRLRNSIAGLLGTHQA